MQHGTLWQLFHKTLIQQPINIESKRAWSESYGPCWLAHYFYYFSYETKENLGGNHPETKRNCPHKRNAHLNTSYSRKKKWRGKRCIPSIIKSRHVFSLYGTLKACVPGEINWSLLQYQICDNQPNVFE